MKSLRTPAAPHISYGTVEDLIRKWVSMRRFIIGLPFSFQESLLSAAEKRFGLRRIQLKYVYVLYAVKKTGGLQSY